MSDDLYNGMTLRDFLKEYRAQPAVAPEITPAGGNATSINNAIPRRCRHFTQGVFTKNPSVDMLV